MTHTNVAGSVLISQAAGYMCDCGGWLWWSGWSAVSHYDPQPRFRLLPDMVDFNISVPLLRLHDGFAACLRSGAAAHRRRRRLCRRTMVSWPTRKRCSATWATAFSGDRRPDHRSSDKEIKLRTLDRHGRELRAGKLKIGTALNFASAPRSSRTIARCSNTCAAQR